MDSDNKNINFVQLDRRAMAAHRQLMIDSPIAAVVLSVLSEYMGKDNAIVISYTALQEMTGYGRTAIGGAIKKLKEEKWIQAVRVGTTNVYLVNSSAFWTASRKGKFYSRFKATVIASATEQRATIETLKAVQLQRTPVVHSGERAVITDEAMPPPDQTDMDLD